MCSCVHTISILQARQGSLTSKAIKNTVQSNKTVLAHYATGAMDVIMAVQQKVGVSECQKKRQKILEMWCVKIDRFWSGEMLE